MPCFTELNNISDCGSMESFPGPKQMRTLVGVVVVIVMLAVYARSRNLALLDLLNWSIEATTDFSPFYAGIEDTSSAVDLYPELKALEDNFDALRREVVNTMQISRQVPCMQKTYNHMFMNATSRDRRKWYHGITMHFWRILYGKHLDIFNNIAADEWRTLNLILHGHVIDRNATLCPLLVHQLVQMDCVQTALLSFMHPGAHVPPHSDPATGVLRYHLAFVVPAERHKCFMLVDGLRYEWEEGKSVIFDTAFEHEVHNTSNECRVVLFVDLHRPLHGISAWLQSLANVANRYSPATQEVIANSGLDAA